PCFSFGKKEGGGSVGVFSKGHTYKWGRAEQVIQEGAVSNLLSANYSAESDLSIFLGMAVRKIAADVAISGRIYQG
ncbi:MAG: haloacid dehalogenase-like hydrolase, partial [Deltaproteobacteria bacterium]